MCVPRSWGKQAYLYFFDIDPPKYPQTFAQSLENFKLGRDPDMDVKVTGERVYCKGDLCLLVLPIRPHECMTSSIDFSYFF